MKDELDQRMDVTPPTPSLVAREQAWQAASRSFHSTLILAQQRKIKHWQSGFLAATAAIVILGLGFSFLFFRPGTPRDSIADQTSEPSTDLATLFKEGKALFGNDLYAVTIAEDAITWHLRSTETSGYPSDQLLTFTLQDKSHTKIQVATAPGFGIPISFNGSQTEVEFLPGASDNIIGSGNGFFVDSDQTGEAISRAQILQLID